MRNAPLIVGFIALGSFVAAPASFAAGGMLKACKKELKKFGCEAKTEAAAHECLEHHDEGKEHHE